MKLLRTLVLTGCCLVTSVLHATAEPPAAREYSLEPTPGWVRMDRPASRAKAATQAAGGVEYLALDRQIRVGTNSADSYSYFVQRVVSDAGIEESSTFTIDFDPHSDAIALHTLQVHRGGRVIDQLGVARITLMRRESRLEEGLLDGNLTLSMVLEDVRVGDIIEFSHTRRYFDPTLGPRYVDSYTTQWSTPVQWSRLRLLYPVDRTIRLQPTGPMDATPRVREADGWKELIWEWRDLPGIPSEGERPSWHAQYPAIQMSEWQRWSDVVDWAIPLYQPGALSPEMKALVTRWMKDSASADERVILALRFVQDQIRYTGIEIGPGAYQPTEPARVLQRRFGDCKDKVVLLITLLKAMNIEAYPALVNTRLKHEITNSLPGPSMFDHVIVTVRHRGHTYWFDPTDFQQGGTLATTVQSDAGAALVVAPSVDRPVLIPRYVPKRPTIEVTEKFDLRAGIEGAGVFEVKTVYHGADADSMRRDLQTSTIGDIARKYLDYYRDLYPGIRASEPLQTRDDRDANQVEVLERYVLEPAFEREDDGSLQLDLNPYVIESHLRAPELTHRKTPLRVRHPINVRYDASVLLPEAWNVKAEEVSVEDPAFFYRSRVKYAKRRFAARYEFRTLADHVTPERVPDYARHLELARNDNGFSFTHGGASAVAPGDTINLAAILAGMFGALAGLALTRRLQRHVPAARPLPPSDAPSGIGGWLLLPALHVCVMPIVTGVALYHYSEFMSFSAWNEIGAGQSDLAAQWLKLGCATLIGFACGMTIVSAYVVYLLFARRPNFPFAYIVLIAISLLWSGLSLLVEINVSPDESEGMTSMARLVRDGLAALGWTAYMLKSTRVAATFLPEQPEPVVPVELAEAA